MSVPDQILAYCQSLMAVKTLLPICHPFYPLPSPSPKHTNLERCQGLGFNTRPDVLHVAVWKVVSFFSSLFAKKKIENILLSSAINTSLNMIPCEYCHTRKLGTHCRMIYEILIKQLMRRNKRNPPVKD